MKSVFATPFIKVNNCHDIHDTELNSSHRRRYRPFIILKFSGISLADWCVTWFESGVSLVEPSALIASQ